MTRSAAEIAAMADHEAVPLNLPRRMEAWLSLRSEGRIDAPDFLLELVVEPQKVAHPWVNYRRNGAILEVGENSWRITPHQLAVFEAYDRVMAAGNSIEARLLAWPGLVTAMHAATSGHVRMHGQWPRVLLKEVEQLPAEGLTRVNGKLCPVAKAPGARWAVTTGHRYYVVRQ